MIKELVNFTKNLDESFKNLEVKCREGLHIILQIVNNDNVLSINTTPTNFEIYSKKMTTETEFINRCKFLSQNAWCIDTNKCFDLPTKAIHSCSPFLVAFKREHLMGGGKFIENAAKNKKQVNERFGSYFEKGFELLEEGEKYKYTVFKNFFVYKEYEKVLNEIEAIQATKSDALTFELETLKATQKDETNKIKKEERSLLIKNLEHELLQFKKLDDAEYLLFYLDETLENYIKPHSKYLADKLFNTDKYNTEPDEEGLIYGTSNFMNSFNSNMPFLSHQTATFNITGRISNTEAKLLMEFNQILGRKILPNPLPIFVFKEELQRETIGLFKESGFRVGYKEIIEKLINIPDYAEDIGNYYLLNWANSTDGIIFRDFDFVSKFEYNYKTKIEDLFEIKYAPQLETIFDFQNELLPVIFNNNFIVKAKDGRIMQKYFDDIDAQYCESALNQILILKYRKAFYDFVYKSKREAITQEMFYDIMKVSILEDIRLDKIENKNHKKYFNIRKKLNIWLSLYEKFNLNSNKNEKTMASKLKDYQEFVAQLSMGKADTENANDKNFAFAAGQVIEYILKKSASDNKSYQWLEPYLQKSKCSELKKAIAVDIAKYKHAIEVSEIRFKSVCDFVLTYETEANTKDLLPELLAGIFSKNQFFHKNENN